jgi:hypothetical protein
MKRTHETAKLSLRRETLKELSVEDLCRVAGGTSGRCNGLVG